MAPLGYIATKFVSCNSLQSSVHTLLVNISLRVIWGVVGVEVVVGAFGEKGRWFDSSSNRHVGTWASSSLVIVCMM